MAKPEHANLVKKLRDLSPSELEVSRERRQRAHPERMSSDPLYKAKFEQDQKKYWNLFMKMREPRILRELQVFIDENEARYWPGWFWWIKLGGG